MGLLREYEVHLRAERDLSAHSVRAYLGDVSSLLDHSVRMQRPGIDQLDLLVLRSWLARQATSGVARSTLARRAAAARTFTAWLARTGRAPTDCGALLATPRSGRTLPAVLRQEEAGALLDVAAVAADDASPTGIRDVALLEVLYASGIRVSELCGLDVEDVDWSRRMLRVLGKGAKERVVPIGIPALTRWNAGSTRLGARSPSGQWSRPVPGRARSSGSIRAPSGGSCTNCLRTSREHPIWGRTASAIRLLPTC